MKLAFKKIDVTKIADIGIFLKNIIKSVLRFDYRGLSFIHIELLFPEEFNNVSFSSDPKDGVRFKDIKYSHPERWVFVDWDYNHFIFGKKYINEQAIYNACRKMVGRGYDWKGIAGQAIGIEELENRELYYCSEIIAHIQGLVPNQLDPQELYKVNVNINKQIARRDKYVAKIR